MQKILPELIHLEAQDIARDLETLPQKLLRLKPNATSDFVISRYEVVKIAIGRCVLLSKVGVRAELWESHDAPDSITLLLEKSAQVLSLLAIDFKKI
ncbi:hypothetical protein DI09_11p60 [Mitosporidium daphniae]|uniref:Uncharacterized protein n=1 Tax=Mitosporidium daphniae TaxID=1485682 RepID=A0A098VZ12_9MICR|nr:uncharacterized protein DI09_11p60 [Mitosporidium daphniae]KGG52961.1 hypothetical protein DI09_11p60 [Mitosporidium daphniae]|eukprot:XP_013239430.1 uncharacterized protein DI09_11p60 [Mitosporidium daphniae]